MFSQSQQGIQSAQGLEIYPTESFNNQFPAISSTSKLHYAPSLNSTNQSLQQQQFNQSTLPAYNLDNQPLPTSNRLINENYVPSSNPIQLQSQQQSQQSQQLNQLPHSFTTNQMSVPNPFPPPRVENQQFIQRPTLQRRGSTIGTTNYNHNNSKIARESAGINNASGNSFAERADTAETSSLVTDARSLFQ